MVDEADAEWAAGYRWCVSASYPARSAGRGVLFYMHREIAVRAGVLTDYVLDARLTDHIDRDHFNNRRSNLRAADHTLSNANRGPRGRTGLLGVEQQTSHGRLIQKWLFSVRRYGVRVRVCGFDSPEAASEARAREIVARGWSS